MDDTVEKIMKKIPDIQDKELVYLIKELLKERQYLVEKANIDMLTGIYNRQIEEHIRDCSVYVIFDIDHFKTVNDTYGHAKGDEILKSVAQIVKKHVRINDYLYRYGGDEFCIAFTNVGKDIVKKRLNTIQEEIRNTVKLPNPNHTITLSIGMIENTNNEKAEELRKKADEALYESKRNGRDQITEYSEYIKKLG